MDCSLLFSSSKIFTNSDLIDQIHQSIIDLKCEKLEQKEIGELLIDALSYLEKDITNELASDLFLLIIQCIMNQPEHQLQILNLILSKSRLNKYYVIITAKIMSYLKCNANQTPLPDYHFFVDDALKSILPHIKNSNQQKISVFKHEIPMEFKLDLIICLLLMVDLTESIVSDFCTYILSQNNKFFYNYMKNEIQILIEKITNAGLINLVLPYFFSNSYLYSILPINEYANFLSQLSDGQFQQLFPQIEKYYLAASKLNSDFLLMLLEKCQLLNLKLSSIEKIFDFLSPEDLSPEIINYLNNYDFVLSADVAKKFLNISNLLFATKIIPSLDEIASDFLDELIFQTYDYEFFNRVLPSTKNPSKIFTQSKFYVHLYNIICKQKDTSKFNLIQTIVKIFQKSVQNKNFNHIIDDIIFSNYPPNHQQIDFLTTFIKSFDDNHLQLYYNSNHMSNLVNKILQENVIPFSSFLQLIDNDSVISIMQNKLLLGQKINPKHFYLYHFSQKNENFDFFPIKLNMAPLIGNNQNLIDFINHNNLDLLTQFDERTLSLVINALIFSENKHILKIEGLTKENIIPFYAIALNNWKKKYSPSEYSLNLFPTNEIQSLFIHSFKDSLNSDSLIIKTSINSIILSDSTNPASLFTKSQIKKEILSISINSLLSNSYNADKTVLFSFLFSNSNSFRDIKINIKNLFEYFIHHLHEINYQSINTKMNFNFLNNSIDIVKLFVNIIENDDSSEIEIMNCINLIMNFCYNIKQITIKNVDNLIKIMQNEENIHNSLLISKFNKFYKISDKIPNITQNIQNDKPNKPINNQTNEIEIMISPILSNKNPEENDCLFYDLFKQMMKNKSLAIGYLLILFHKIDSKPMIKTEEFINLYYNEYNDDTKTFIQVLNMIRVLRPKKKYLSKKAKITEYKYNASEVEELITQYLFDSIKQKPCNYQAFYCLNSIACTFPFLFESKDQQIFDIVLSELDNYSLLFEDDEDEQRETKVKTSNAALSFLISILHSNKIIDSFFIWLFKNISTFSNSAVYCINFIIYSALKTEVVRTLILSFLLEYNFIEIIQELMKREIQDGIFKDNYFYMIYLLLNEYYNSIDLCDEIDCIEINHFQNTKDRFYSYFDHQSTFIPYRINQIQNNLFLRIPDSKVNKNILTFIKKLNITKKFWIHNSLKLKKNYQIEQKIINHFLREYSLINRSPRQANCSNPKNSINYDQMTVKMAECLFTKERWIQDWIFKDNKYQIMTEHYNVLSDVYKELNNIKNQHDIKVNDYNVENYFSKQYEQNDLFKHLTNEVNALSKNDVISEQIYKIIQTISKKNNMMKTFISLISNNLDEIKNKNSNGEDIFNLLDKNMSLLLQLSEKYEFQHYFVDICFSKLLQICLSPYSRFNNDSLIKMANILCKIKDTKLPLRTTHLIGFMLVRSYDENVLIALKLCTKFTFDELDHIKIIKQSFNNELKNKSLSKIIKFLRCIPSLLNLYCDELTDLLDNCLDKIEKNENNDQSLIHFSFLLTDLLMPKRDEKQQILLNDSISDIESFQQIPNNIFEKNKKFWSTFDKHKVILDKIIQNQLLNNQNNNVKLDLLNKYPEFFSFPLRLKLFQNKMKQQIQSEKLQLFIDTNNILESSFNQLYDLSQSEWKNRIVIKYINQDGEDMGGVRRDWFIKLSTKLFDPDYGLFCLTEQLNVQPNSFSGINPDHYKYFNFAGRIVARALLQGENIEANLSRSFLCHILHRKVKLEDLKSIDAYLFKSLHSYLENDMDKPPFDETYFEYDIKHFGSFETIELKPNGKNIRVTNEDKNEYVDLIIDYISRKSIIEQINSFLDGFESIIPYKDIQMFSPKELNLMICGCSKIDVDDMEKNTLIEFPLTKKSPNVMLFFKAIKKWENSDLVKLLMFITGSSRVPATGFKYLKDIGYPIKIQTGGDRNRLPQAHTCFNTIDLPNYETENEINQKLLMAIHVMNFHII